MNWFKTQLSNLAVLSVVIIGLAFVSLPLTQIEAAPFDELRTRPASASTLKREKITITTTGSAGSATGTATTNAVICGHVLRVDVDYSASAPATSDLTFKEVDDLIDTNVVVKANSVTDAQYFPTVGLTDSGGTARNYAATFPVVDYYPVCDRMIASVVQSDALAAAVVIEVYWKEQ